VKTWQKPQKRAVKLTSERCIEFGRHSSGTPILSRKEFLRFAEKARLKILSRIAS